MTPSIALDLTKCDLCRILYHHWTSWPLNNWRTRAGIISCWPPLNLSKIAFRIRTRTRSSGESLIHSWRFNFDVSSHCTTFLAYVFSWRNSCNSKQSSWSLPLPFIGVIRSVWLGGVVRWSGCWQVKFSYLIIQIVQILPEFHPLPRPSGPRLQPAPGTLHYWAEQGLKHWLSVN